MTLTERIQNLIKRYIDSEEEIRKYREYVSKLGICDIGLVNLMKKKIMQGFNKAVLNKL